MHSQDQIAAGGILNRFTERILIEARENFERIYQNTDLICLTKYSSRDTVPLTHLNRRAG
jgi:hypothetical protein